MPGGCNVWIGDGFCDDINNNMECTYDGGDCCGSNVNTQYCTECSCLDPNGNNGANSTTTSIGTTATTTTTTTTGTTGTTATNGTTKTTIAGCNFGWISDGYCDDINNNMECTYDGGDCCGPNVNTQYCTECLCIDPNGNSTSTAAPTTTTGKETLYTKPWTY